MTEFKVGDRVRHKEFPDITGEVFSWVRGFVWFTDAAGGNVGYPLSEVEHVHATEEDKQETLGGLPVVETDIPWRYRVDGLAGMFEGPTDKDDAWASAAERAELKGWAKGVSDMDKADEEVRVVNASTGGEKGQKLARFDLIPVGPLWQVAELYGQGATKYEDRNWEKGYDWSLSYAALMRHATLFWGGEDADPKDGNSHLASVVFHALALMDYTVNHPELDDRPKPKS